MSNIVITHSGSNTHVVSDGTSITWVTADATVTAVDDTTISVTVGGVPIITLNIYDIVSIDSAKPYGNAGDVVTQITNASGGGSSSYSVYTALLTQSGTDAPVATVLQNTLGGTVLWTRFSEGIYIGTLAGAFAADKTLVIAQQANSGNSLGIDVGNDSVDAIYLTTFNIGTGANADGQLINAPVEIRAYP
jgi:hypothetical protein